MQKTFIGILIIILAVVLFALNNSTTVNIDFWIWNVESNLSLVLILSVIFGAFSSYLLSLPYSTKKKHEIKERDKRIKSMEDEILRLKKDKPDSFDKVK
jgi:uncharacterized integral membrane protein